jgi:hypothetical protein
MPQHHGRGDDDHANGRAPTTTLRELSRMRRQTVRALLLQHVEMEQQQQQVQEQQQVQPPEQPQQQPHVQQESYNHSTTTTTDTGADYSGRMDAAATAGTASLVRELSRWRRQNRRTLLQRVELERQDQQTTIALQADKLRPSLSTVSERTDEEEVQQQQQQQPQQQYDDDDDDAMIGTIMRIKSPSSSTTTNQPNLDHQSPLRGRGSRHRVHDRRLESPLRE